LSGIAGILAGLLGVGSGMIMSPTLLTLDCPPMSLAATTGFLVVQTSLIALFQSLLYGDVLLTEVLFFLIASLIGSYGISAILEYLVNKYKRPSIVLFALSAIIGLSIVALPLFGIFRAFDKPENMLQFKSIC
jgi:uncharacterized membrane protein YfcA